MRVAIWTMPANHRSSGQGWRRGRGGGGGVIVYPGNSLVWAAPRVRGVIEL